MHSLECVRVPVCPCRCMCVLVSLLVCSVAISDTSGTSKDCSLYQCLLINVRSQRIGSIVRAKSAGCSKKCMLELLNNDPELRFLQTKKEECVIPLSCVYMRFLVRVRAPVCLCQGMCVLVSSSVWPVAISNRIRGEKDYACAHVPVCACVCPYVCISIAISDQTRYSSAL